LIDSQLTVPKDTKGVRVAPAAIENAGMLFARNVGTAGYKAAVDNQAGTKQPAPGPAIDEYVSHAVLSQLPGPERSLGLAIEETPHPPIDPLEQWVAPDPNGVQEVEITDARGQKRKVPDHTAAIQKAIDSGKGTLYFPRGNWQVHGTVLLRGNIRRVTGLEGAVAGTG